ncbi:hypothetical protein [Accumulibacter sp.]|uniref:hypothetical protein n=1 Tax=Accumulibacter sp. TaxID=2053492 RepID=UPI00262E2C06|nr:hypothetical protein [Accumulibacter sp.]
MKKEKAVLPPADRSPGVPRQLGWQETGPSLFSTRQPEHPGSTLRADIIPPPPSPWYPIRVD